MKFLCLLLIFHFTADASSELFSAIEELESLSYNQGKLINELSEVIKNIEETASHLKRYVKTIKKDQDLMLRDVHSFILNPLNAFVLIKRLSFDIFQTRDKIIGIGDQFAENTNNIRLPRSDFEGAVEGLVRLQAIYSLESKDLAKGIIQGDKYRDELTANELFALGDELIQTHRNYLSESYLSLALEKNEESNEMSEIVILERIYANHNATGNSKKALKTLEKMIELEPERKDLEAEMIKLEIEELFKDEPEQDETDIHSEEIKDGRFTALRETKLVIEACSGRLKKSDHELSKLHCRFVSNSAYSKLCPFKVEEANLSPYVAIFHDVMSDKEVQAFKSLAKPNLFRASTLKPDASSKIDNVRVAKISWHNDFGHKVFERLSKRVGDMSGLNMETAEIFQTQNYGIGGHYDTHYDFTTKEAKPFELGTGNRIATVLFYLSDVEKGGATIFPYLSLTVSPKKGAAVFWYNLSTSGELEFLTRHAACPVLVGSKWVSNKWLHEYGQEWTRPCELKPALTDEFFYKKVF